MGDEDYFFIVRQFKLIWVSDSVWKRSAFAFSAFGDF